MMFVDIPYKYLGLIFITYENIKKVKCIIFSDLTVVATARLLVQKIVLQFSLHFTNGLDSAFLD